MFEVIAAALVLAVCAALLLRQVLPPRRRDRLDRWAQGVWTTLRELPAQWKRERSVQRETKDVIERARKASKRTPPVERDGNVYRPDAFKSDQPPSDRLH
jgi:hypothetical protein